MLYHTNTLTTTIKYILRNTYIKSISTPRDHPKSIGERSFTTILYKQVCLQVAHHISLGHQSKKKRHQKQMAHEPNRSSNWIKDIRALPLKGSEIADKVTPEYIDQNFNNSRRLIRNLNDLTSKSSEYSEQLQKKSTNLSKIENCLGTLKWLN